MTTGSEKLFIEKLVIVGVKKNYVVPFNPGVNIIYGDSGTGKSSILNLIDYLLGGKEFSSYPEIESAAKYAVLVLKISGSAYCIKRDIFDSKKMVEVYKCQFSEIEKHSPSKYIPSYSNDSLSEEFGFFSDFLLDALNYERVKIKDSPSKESSSLSRLSFRDIFKYCYVDQDDLGSKSFMDRGNFVLEAKHTEVFRYIFNALDSQISEINAEISSKSNRKSGLEKKFENISDFLRDTDFSSKESINDALEEIDRDIEYLEDRIADAKQRHTSNNELYHSVKEALDLVNRDVSLKESEFSDSQEKLEYFSRLKNDYLIDIRKFKSALEYEKRVGTEGDGEISICPVCDNTLPISDVCEKFDISDSDKITYEINSLKRRAKETEKHIASNRDTRETASETLKNLYLKRDEIRSVLDKNEKAIVTPYLAEVDTLLSKLASLKQKKKELISNIRIRNQQDTIYENIQQLEKAIQQLRERLKVLEENSPSVADILGNMSTYLNEYLKKVNIKDRYRVGVSQNKYFPYVRDIEYPKITSGGLRTITSIGYLCSFMTAALTYEMNYPCLLMIDTVGKYLGKTGEKRKYLGETSSDEDRKEGVSDPEKYKNIYEYLIELSEKYEGKSRSCQIILVDNDVPAEVVKQYSGFVVAHFSSEGLNNLKVGLIDDADIQNVID